MNPVTLWLVAQFEQGGRLVLVIDHDFDRTVIVIIAERRASRRMPFFERGACKCRRFTKFPFPVFL